MDAAQKAAADWVSTNLANLKKLAPNTENYTKEWNKTAKSEIIFTVHYIFRPFNKFGYSKILHYWR